jgi:amino acid transporter
MEQKGSDAKTLFTRNATGFVKSVSFFDSISINMIYMSIGAGLAGIGFSTILLPTMSGVNLVYASLIAAILTIPQAIVYSLMTQRMPRTGADYVWLSRSLGGWFGSSITFMGITMETMPYVALIAISFVFAIGSVGLFFNSSNSTYLGLAIPNTPGAVGALPTLQFEVSALAVMLLILLNIFFPRVGIKLVTGCFVVGIVALILSIAFMLNAGASGVSSYVNSLAIKNTTYQSIAAAYSGSSFSLVPTLLMIPFFYIYTYPWFNGLVAVGSELRGRNTSKWNAPISLILATVITTVPFAVMYYVAGLPFINSALTNSNLVVNYSFNFWTLGMGVAPNFTLAFVVGLGWIVWDVGIMAYGIILISRYLFAQSFDRFLPGKLATVSERFGSPIYAHIVDLIITVIVIGLGIRFYGTAANLYGNVAASMMFFGFVGAAAAIYAIRQETRGSLTRTLLAVAGVMQAVVFAFVSYLFFAYASVWGGNYLSYGYIVASFVGGVAIYFASRSYHLRKSGLNIDLIFKEIPPE